MTIGSLCTGYGGLDMAAEAVFGGEVAWVSDVDPDVNRLLEVRYPGIPNVGDITEEPDLPPVDVVTAGFPCQPFSTAGRRKGSSDDRYIWPAIAAAVGRMDPRPRLFLLENVPGLLTIEGGDAMARVVHDLAALGYMGQYRLLRASDVGACHQRRRWFCVASHTDGGGVGPDARVDRGDASGDGGGEPSPVSAGPEVSHAANAPQSGYLPTPQSSDGSRGPDYARERDRRESHGSGGDDLTTAVAKLPTPTGRDWKGHDPRSSWDRLRRARGEGGTSSLPDVAHVVGKMLPTPTAQAAKHGESADVHANAHGYNLWDVPHLLPTPAAVMGDGGNINRSGDRADELLLGGILRSHDPEVWGPYAEALDRHAAIVGSPAPSPVDDGKLNPGFVEWMMMLPDGWVTELGFTRSSQLRMLGNGVVPVQAAVAYLSLLDAAVAA